ncbi:MAG TPA: prephenate dehydrogenase/arogenate dehydrogenase family protein [Casimicrobiaceae bacterium]|nr:prephenate dehydrogenase/arogenate dehydrogenase family protein [Casimicrobiaceae bacterium]
MNRLRKLVIVGVGLIGGSVSLALKQRGSVGEVVGVGRSRENLDVARDASVVDRAFTLDENWLPEVGDADIVLIATPVAQIPGILANLSLALGARTIVTDAGSTKQDVVAAARERLGSALPRFVPAHPVAGTENFGAAAAFASLFEGRQTIVTPLPETDAAALQAVRELWEACGARVVELDPEDHDRILAAVSHLPHVLAAAYVASLAVRSDALSLFAHAGGGFRDFTRIAAASPEMWRDITLANRKALIEEIAAYRGALDVIESAIEASDREAIETLFGSASAARRGYSRDRGEG